ncbi:TPA: helix-turn-helix transcriptional regulator [Candidatus Scatenecus faecavium]|uniref:Helix-turn-helix transcriptional regulator n=1 Tax=Candidatus Scatenecus faecavium TaxID=2840915 RepID=A0A9D1FWL2_9BACT|nr:helix-turn-helix transcriptional regulator [Candidatus Scatenecus faecavium]
MRKIKTEYKCPLEATMDIIGGKYKGIILGHLIQRTLRYNELQKLIPQATPKMLIQQLKELEADGIVERKLYPVVPPKTEYSLSERGKTLIPIIIELNNWGIAYLKEQNIPCKYVEDLSSS